MKKGRFSEEQIIAILKQHEAGRKVPHFTFTSDGKCLITPGNNNINIWEQ